MPSAANRAPAEVAIVSSNLETLKGLQEYLGNAGFKCHVAPGLADLATIPVSRACSIVVFPDDFATPDVISILRELNRNRPGLLAVVVTGEPTRYRTAIEQAPGSAVPVVLARPSFGWEIVDTIRAHISQHDVATGRER